MNALIDLSVIFNHDQSIPDRFFFSSPFKLVKMNADAQHTLELMLMNASPGTLDGDDYKVRIDIGKRASLQIHTQAYQRIFTMIGSASQESQITIGANASFTFLPHPTVPHKGSNFKADTEIRMHVDARLNYGELITCGRKHSGERFEYTRFHSVLKIYSDDKLILKDNQLFEPNLMNLESMGQLEGFTHTATYIHISPDPELDLLLDHLYKWMLLHNEIVFGISRFHERGIIIRMLGNKSEILFNCMLGTLEQIKIQQALRKEIEYDG